MKRIISLLITLALSTTFAISQDCTLFIPGKVGTELHYQIKNEKGKVEGTYIHKMISKKESAGQMIFEMLQTFMDPKSPEAILMQDTIRFRCKDNIFYIDMDKFLNQKQMEAFKDMPVILDKIASGEYFAVALAYKYDEFDEEEYMYMLDLMEPYYKISKGTFMKRSETLQIEGMEKGIFFDELCYNC